MGERLDSHRDGGWEVEYTALRPLLERRFRGRFPSLRGQESDFYNEAWESLLRQEEVAKPRAFLERAMYARGIDELRRDQRRPHGTADADAPAVAEAVSDRTDRLTDELALDGLDGRERQALLLDRLSQRQQRIVKLHWGWGLNTPEVAAALGVSRRTVKREIEDAAPLVIENAEWLTPCPRGGRRSLVKAYVLGILSDARAAKALAHLDECASCRALRTQLEEALRGVAAAIPPVAVAEPPASSGSLLERLVQAADAAREQAAELAGAAKQQAAAAIGRAPGGDAATQVAAGGGLRGSGTMLATAVGCLAIGGGTVTYCAVEGMPDPVRAVIPGVDTKERAATEERPESAQAAEPPAQPAAPVVATEPPPPAPAPVSKAREQTPSPQETAPAPPPPAEEEFGIEQTAAPSAGGSTASSAPSAPVQRAPAPAPSGGGGEEFGFER